MWEYKLIQIARSSTEESIWKKAVLVAVQSRWNNDKSFIVTSGNKQVWDHTIW